MSSTTPNLTDPASPIPPGGGWDCETPSGEIQAEPDVAGIGIIIGFVGTAWLVVCILVVYSVTYYDPTLDPFSASSNQKLVRPNAVDMMFYKLKLGVLRPLDTMGERYKTIGRLRRKLSSRVGRDVFIEVVMALSDTQIVTGIAILVSGYYSATQGMSGYHWRMLVRIAWFSTITHLAALSCLRSHLHQNIFRRSIRLFLMTCLAIMLIVATLVTTDGAFRDDLPAICFLDITRPKERLNLDTLLSVLLLIYNILLRALKLHQTFSEGGSRAIRRAFPRVVLPVFKPFLTYILPNNRFHRLKLVAYVLIVQVSIAVLVVAKTYYILYTSMVAEIYWLLVSAFFGTLSLFELREARPQGEDVWTFGQVVTCALFLAPVLALVDTVPKVWGKGEEFLSRIDSDDRSPPSDRYTNWINDDKTSATRLARFDTIHGTGNATTETSTAVETTLLEPIQIKETRSFSILSAQPLLIYNPETPEQPFLGFFEDLPCFTYLTIQLCIWFVFLTFWIFFGQFELFHSISWSFFREDGSVNKLKSFGLPGLEAVDALQPDVPYGRFDSPESQTLGILLTLPWILLFGPTYSVVYLLIYPRRALFKIPWEKHRVLLLPLRVFLNLIVPVGLIVLAMWSWASFSLELCLYMWAALIVLYVIFTLLHAFLSPRLEAQ